MDDKLISKLQCAIKWEAGKWLLLDGKEGKPSTNGTWYFLDQERAIEDGMMFKKNQTCFIANLVEKSFSAFLDKK